MYQEPNVSGLSSSYVCETWPSYDCHSCLLCLGCLITPAPDIDLMDVQGLWGLM